MLHGDDQFQSCVSAIETQMREVLAVSRTFATSSAIPYSYSDSLQNCMAHTINLTYSVHNDMAHTINQSAYQRRQQCGGC